MKDLPQTLSVHAIECLLEIDKVDAQRCVPLERLFQDVSSSKYLIHTTSSTSKPSLFLPECRIDSLFNALKQYPAQYLTWYRK